MIKDIYYSQKPMQVYDAGLSKLLNKFVKNYSREEVAAEFNISGKKCLDIACGDGDLINNFLHKRYGTAEGVDISEKLIALARSKKARNSIFYVSEIDEFVAKAIKKHKRYDSIYLLAILEHIQWPSIFLKSISKILKKGGHVIVEVPNVCWLPHRISTFFGKFPITAPTNGVIPGVYDEHIRFFTKETLLKVGKEAGLKYIKSDCSGKFRNIKKINLSLLSPDIVMLFRK